MQRGELNEDGATWVLPATRSKNRKAHTVPLPPLARDILASVKRLDSCDYVFSTTGRSPVSGFSKMKARLDKEMKISDWRLHDLRRTAATGMAALGVSLPVIERVLNHVSGSFGGIVGVYQRHEFEPEKRAALERWARHVTGLKDKPSNVTSLPRKKRHESR